MGGSLYYFAPKKDVDGMVPKGKSDLERLNAIFLGHPLLPGWQPLSFKLPRHKPEKKYVDISYLYRGALAVANHARDTLDEIVGRDAEWLQVDFYGESYWILNPFLEYDLIDWERSKRLPHVSERNFYCVYHFEALHILSQTLYKPCFKLKKLSEHIYSQQFVDAVDQARLTMGVEFKQVSFSKSI